MPAWLKDLSDGVEIRVKVVPGASRDRIAGLLGDSLKIQVSAAPERGKANEAAAALLARQLKIHARDLTLVRGATSPNKVFVVRGMTSEQVTAAMMVT